MRRLNRSYGSDSEKAEEKKKSRKSPKEGRSGKKQKNAVPAAIQSAECTLTLSGRELTTIRAEQAHPLFWVLVSFLQLTLLVGGLVQVYISGYALNINGMLFYPVMLFLCAGMTGYFYFCGEHGKWLIALFPGVLGYLGILFLTQHTFLNGALQMGSAMMESVNQRYEADFSVAVSGGDVSALSVFLIEILVPICIMLAACVVYRADALWMSLILLPPTAWVLLSANQLNIGAMFMLLFGLLSVFASAHSIRKKRMWGERTGRRYKENLISHKNVQRKTAVILCVLSIVLSVPGFYVVRPMLGLQLDKAQRVTAKVEGKVLTALLDLLPKVSGGQWNLRVETAGSGVADGVLGDTEGIAMEGVEDLKLTASAEPKETIYLKGFVGSEYHKNRWDAPEKEAFLNAASNWKTEGDSMLYIQNLSFLRALYVENSRGGDSMMQELTVERIHADSSYSYLPYDAFLNEYYEIESGDGGVNGQDAQDDIFSYYPRKSYDTLMESWNKDEDNQSVLDLTEQSYAAYVKSKYLHVPDGFEKLKKQCEKQVEKKKIKDGDTDKVQAYIKTWLSENYTYSLDAPVLPDGEDFVQYFLYESKTGYSTHFASAATLMFRMCGVPARYVTGYAAPKNLFTIQPDGTYTAVLQDDNSHAWVEIYVDGEGWTPVEMTPGALGTAEEVEFQSDETSDEGDLKEEETKGNKVTDSVEKVQTAAASLWKKLLDGSLESVIHLFAVLTVVGIVLPITVKRIRRYRRDYGLGRRKSENERIGDMFRAIYRELVKKGISPEIESTSEKFVQFAVKRCPQVSEGEIRELVDIVLESSYGNRALTEQEVVEVRNLLRKIKRKK